MVGDLGEQRAHSSNKLRIAAWSTAAGLLMVPLIAMQFSDEVQWTLGDFVIAGVLIVGVGLAYEFIVRMTGNTAYRVAAGLALVATFLLIWVNGAVGLIGSENNDANLMYGGVLAVELIGVIIARFHARRMAIALFATAAVQVVITGIAVALQLGVPENSTAQVIGVNAFFVALFVSSGLLFLRADQPESDSRAN